MPGKILHAYEDSLERAKNIDLLSDARKEIIHMQLKTTYRERMKQLYEAVKRRLDYQVVLQNARKDFERTNMINWITSEVKNLSQLRQITSQTR
jgi:hypothetical protein